MEIQKKKFYITTTLPYVNDEPHIGFAMEIIKADVIARYHEAQGDEVIFNTGTDEHGLKIYRKALEQGKDPQEYVDEYAEKFKELKSLLNLSFTHFIQTSNPEHKKAAQEFWRICAAHDDIYKKSYRIKYCVGCELEKTDSELTDGACPIHPHLKLELIEEENYFFRFSKYQQPLLDFYETHPDFVMPSFRFNEIKRFVSDCLQDFSISRLKAKMPWGVLVPDDPEQVMYVWFDALINYISTLGWPEDARHEFKNFWPGTQIAGKDNLRQQSAMWQAMLMSAGLSPSKQILIQGFITVDGQKMSKSLGNVIAPKTLVEKYGTDPVRYYLLREISSGEDGDFSIKKFEERYNGDLANGLGNLVARVATLGEKVSPVSLQQNEEMMKEIERVCALAQQYIESFRLNEALGVIWELIGYGDRHINDTKPWAIKNDTATLQNIIAGASVLIDAIRESIEPFLPETAQKIREQISVEGDMIKIKRGNMLFPRLQEKI
ncbi:MAG: methionine--tRNA ligase [Patescibacteria group bacterium]